MKQLLKYAFLFTIGGGLYFCIEIVYRGFSHWAMFILGGLCFICIGLINKWISWKTPLWKQSLIGAAIITLLEFLTGCIVNILLEWNIWDYSKVQFNLLGQICLPFFALWIIIATIAIILDDYLRYWIFKEEKPRYVLF